WNWSKAQQALSRVPASRSEDISGDPDAVAAIFASVAQEGRRMLTEPEAKSVIAAYGIPVPATHSVRSPEETRAAALDLLKSHRQVAVKLLSKAITHKSDVG